MRKMKNKCKLDYAIKVKRNIITVTDQKTPDAVFRFKNYINLDTGRLNPKFKSSLKAWVRNNTTYTEIITDRFIHRVGKEINKLILHIKYNNILTTKL